MDASKLIPDATSKMTSATSLQYKNNHWPLKSEKKKTTELNGYNIMRMFGMLSIKIQYNVLCNRISNIIKKKKYQLKTITGY